MLSVLASKRDPIQIKAAAFIWQMNHNEEIGRLYDGKCYYDVEYEYWSHASREECNHKLPDELLPPFSEEIVNGARAALDRLKRDAAVANQNLEALVQSMMKSGENVHDITEYVRLWRCLSLPREVIPNYTLGIRLEGENKAILCTRDYALETMKSSQGYGFKYI